MPATRPARTTADLRTSRPVLALVALGVLGATLSACSTEAGDATVKVKASDGECTPDRSTVAAGVTTFSVVNSASDVNEIYVLRPDGSIVAERENIGPNTAADLTVELAAGSYTLRCKPGMKGDGISAAFTVSGEAKAAASADPRLAAAVAKYRTYVEDQAEQSLAGAKDLQAALAAGDVAKAKKLYASSRVGWERMEPVAEAFGDIDPKVDLREADLEAGQTWTGWHVIEKALWTTNSTAGTAPVATQLVTDLTDLVDRIGTAEITPTSMANGAKELLDEVATGKVTGEEEAFSHTDLVDFQANVDGARMVVDLLGPVLTEKDAALQQQLVDRFAALQELLAQYGQGADFVSYDTVGAPARQKLADAVDALAEPLSKVAATVVKA